MGWAEILLLSVALAMDCFTVSVINGVVVGRWQGRVVLRTALFFGLFQALMPLLGWLLTSSFARYVEAYDHWVAFLLLAYLGIRMMLDAGKPDGGYHLNPRALGTQLLQAVATSIDALAVGISMVMVGYRDVESLFTPLTVIGMGSVLFAVLGYSLGIKFGAGIRRRLKPELFGGTILLFIGVKILLSHLLSHLL